jgi:hypothetical protein
MLNRVTLEEGKTKPSDTKLQVRFYHRINLITIKVMIHPTNDQKLDVSSYEQFFLSPFMTLEGLQEYNCCMYSIIYAL